MVGTDSTNPPCHLETTESSAPLYPDIGVVAFVPEEWGGPWMSRHQVLTRLSKYFHVVWAEPAKEWRDLWLGGGKSAAQSNLQELLPPGFVRYEPGKWLPQLYRPAFLAAWIAGERVRQAAALLRQRGCKTIVFYLWRPTFDYVLDNAPCDLSCYHIVDEYSFSPSEQPLNNREIELIKRVDQVFIHSQGLLERKGHFNPHTLLVPNGVDYQAFATPQAEPDDLKNIARPRIGYVGHIKPQLDLRLLHDLAIRHAEWSFVFVGPKGHLGADAPLVDQLSTLPNVHFLGNKPIESVCAYPQHLDVCLLPYVFNDYTGHIYPLKLHEYLAGGNPVVGTPIRSLEPFGHVIALARGIDEWEACILAALAPTQRGDLERQGRRAVAQKYDWNVLVERIAHTICEKLGQATTA